MLTLALAGSAFLMGVVGCVHCAAMCVASCAVVSGGRRAGVAAFHGGRLLGYAAGGAVAAASVGGLLRWEIASGALRPLWLGVQLAALMFGLLLAWRARMVERPAVRTVIGRMGAWLLSQGRESPGYIAGAVAEARG